MAQSIVKDGSTGNAHHGLIQLVDFPIKVFAGQMVEECMIMEVSGIVGMRQREPQSFA